MEFRILEWVAILFSRGSNPRIKPKSPALQADATKPIGKSSKFEAASIFRLLVFKERGWGEIWKGRR